MKTFWKDYEIVLTPDMRFRVEFDEDNARTFDTHREAKAAIDGVIKAEAKAKAAMLDLRVVNDKAEPLTIKGLHGRRGTVLFKERASGRGGEGLLYPDTPWLRDAIIHRNTLAHALRAANERIEDFSLNAARKRWGEIKGPEEFANLLDMLIKEHAEKLAKAETTAAETAKAAMLNAVRGDK